jgi:hypothetical protein
MNGRPDYRARAEDKRLVPGFFSSMQEMAVVATVRSVWIKPSPAGRQFGRAFVVFLGGDAATAASSATARCMWLHENPRSSARRSDGGFT